MLAKEQFRPLSEPIRLDILQPRNTEGEKVTEYRYDVLGNRIQTILPSGETLNYLYYGSGHLHHINLDGDTLSDIERDDLHRPISRSAGKLHSRFELDPLGRLKQQLAELQPEHHQPETLIGRRYQYDKVGNLTRTEDQRSGHKDYAYDPLGRITAAGDERFAFDPAHNILSRMGDNPSEQPVQSQRVKGNRLTEYDGTRYVYDGLGNLSEQHDDDGSRYYRYDADNQLIEARIEKAGKPAEVWRYRYDALGRRISKASLNRKTEFIWEGSRLLQEYAPNGVYSYVYTEQGSYEPLAQIFKADGATQNEVLYYHNDQIGIPRELTDTEGNIVWSGEYSGWGKLTNPDNACLKKGVHQPFRLQNQYADKETGLHYNFFRYYDPHCGRFTQQDPIGLMGGDNTYRFGSAAQSWIDPIGLEGVPLQLQNYINSHGMQLDANAAMAKFQTKAMAQQAAREAAEREAYVKRHSLNIGLNNHAGNCFSGGGQLSKVEREELAICQRRLARNQATMALATGLTAGAGGTAVAGGALAGGAALGGAKATAAAGAVAVRGGQAIKSGVQAFNQLSKVEKTVGIATATSGANQIRNNGRMALCDTAADVAGATVGGRYVKLLPQVGTAAGTGAFSDAICQNKSVTEVLKGIPGNAVGAGAAYKAGKTGVGDFGQTGVSELGREITNRSVNSVTTKPNK